MIIHILSVVTSAGRFEAVGETYDQAYELLAKALTRYGKRNALPETWFVPFLGSLSHRDIKTGVAYLEGKRFN